MMFNMKFMEPNFFVVSKFWQQLYVYFICGLSCFRLLGNLLAAIQVYSTYVHLKQP